MAEYRSTPNFIDRWPLGGVTRIGRGVGSCEAIMLYLVVTDNY